MEKLALKALILFGVAQLSFIAGCAFLQPSPETKALKAVEEALSGKPGWELTDLTIKIEDLHVTVAGEVGSDIIAAQISEELQKLVDLGVIKSFQNNCTILDVTNPLLQDYTPPTLAF